MNYIAAVFVVVLVAVASAETGDFVPKAFYTIDSNGVQSAPSLINPLSTSELLHRLKRQSGSGFTSSSASSSSSQQAGGPVWFQQTSSTQVGPGTFPLNNPLFPNNLADRFGPGDSNDGNSGINQQSTGTFQQVSGYVLPNGQVNYQTNNGKF